MRMIIKNLNPNKASGHDGMTNCVNKQLPCNFVNHFVAIYISALKLQHFPVYWKKGATIPKEGKDPKVPQNRIPISILSCLGKIYEKIVLEKLK